MSIEQITIDHPDTLSYSRCQVQTTLLLKNMQSFKHIKNQIEYVQSRISKLRDDRDRLRSKRMKLMSTNFSSAPHLKKAHRKYWDDLQHIIKEMNNLQKKETELNEELRYVGSKIKRYKNKVTNKIQ